MRKLSTVSAALLLITAVAAPTQAQDTRTAIAGDRSIQTATIGTETRTTVIDRVTAAGPETKLPPNEMMNRILQAFFGTYATASDMLRTKDGASYHTGALCRVTDDNWVHSRPCTRAERTAMDRGVPLPAPSALEQALSVKSIVIERTAD